VSTAWGTAEGKLQECSAEQLQAECKWSRKQMVLSMRKKTQRSTVDIIVPRVGAS